MEQLLDVLARFPAGILGRQDGDQQRDHAAHHRVDAAGEGAAGRRRQQNHQQRLQRQLGGEDVAAVQEAGQQDGDQKHDGGLPDPGPEPVEQHVAHGDADGAAQAHLHHPSHAQIAGEAEGDQGGRGGEQRAGMAQDVLCEGIGSHGAEGHLDPGDQ
ncbi:hypothetical protein QFZ33_000504 [Arthrobacter globiformis]|nr:hypothetical protein [Arthrobacter globiformis]